MKELNDYLEQKGCSTHLKHKRQLAAAFGLQMDNGTPEQQSALLRALKAGEMASNGSAKESFKIEVAFAWNEDREFANAQEAGAYQYERTQAGRHCRLLKVTSISQEL